MRDSLQRQQSMSGVREVRLSLTFFGVTASAIATLFDINCQELGAQTLNLLSHGGSGVEAFDYGAHSASGANSAETRNTGSNDKYGSRRDLAS